LNQVLRFSHYFHRLLFLALMIINFKNLAERSLINRGQNLISKSDLITNLIFVKLIIFCIFFLWRNEFSLVNYMINLIVSIYLVGIISACSCTFNGALHNIFEIFSHVVNLFVLFELVNLFSRQVIFKVFKHVI